MVHMEIPYTDIIFTHVKGYWPARNYEKASFYKGRETFVVVCLLRFLITYKKPRALWHPSNASLVVIIK